MKSMSTGIKYPYCNPEIWGGIECTINRVGDEFRDQLEESGHYIRNDDIDKVASLGISKIRYPVLWEFHQATPDTSIDWSWTEMQLNKIRKHGIDPIVGLLHHGSGPSFTDLLDDQFPGLLAAYAARVAAKFPWVQYYTPVNEPLTTARFSALYGFWYPHARDEASFIKALVNQVKGTLLAMEAIRKINPAAQLVQTEDLSKVHSSSQLQYQADYENERRWLTYDLLCGKVDATHFFWKHFIDHGIDESELLFFIEHACPPSIIGCNYYVTSERYLDHQLEKYPAHLHGGNGKHRYADTEAVRVIEPMGVAVLMREAWDRYGLPLAITECHLSCSREEQMRWFKETWEQCCNLKSTGVEVRAVTAWSLFGAFDWNSLLVVKNSNYESGVFDLAGGGVRETALYKMIRSLATNGRYHHPLLDEAGWWKKVFQKETMRPKTIQKRPLLIVGRNGTLGQAFIRTCDRRSIPVVALSRNELDIASADEIQKVMDVYKPWAVINAAGYVRVDDAEMNSNECFAINATGPGLLAKACAVHGIPFMTFSSDLVFDGNKKMPYHEVDSVNPLNVYGASKADGENQVMTNYPSSLIIRTSAFFGPWDRYNFVYTVLESLKNDQPVEMPNDVIVSPTYVPDLADTSLDLFIDEEKGIWHLSNEGMMTWAELAKVIAGRAGYDAARLHSKPLIEMGWKAMRPLYSVLQSEKGVKMPALDDALVRYFEQRSV